METIRGTLEYRSPNIFETLELIGTCQLHDGYSMNHAQGKIIRNLEPFIDYAQLRNEDGKSYKSYEEMCGDFELLLPLCEIANEVLDSFIQGSKKKKS